MIRKITILFFLLLLLDHSSFSQDVQFFGLNNYSGELSLQGFTKSQDIISDNVLEKQLTRYTSAGLQLYTSSHIWDPRFFTFDVDLGYNPASQRNLFLVTPDRSEVRSLKNLGLRGTLLNQKPVSLITFFNFNDNFIKRDLLTDVRYNSKLVGGILLIKNVEYPASIEYQMNNWRQKEVETGRLSNNNQSTFRWKMSKSFAERDYSNASYSHVENSLRSFERNEIQNKRDIFNFQNTLFFDSLKKQSVRSSFTLYEQNGNQTYRRTQLFENLEFSLPYRFKWYGDYLLTKNDQINNSNNFNTIKSRLEHQLYSSLNTSVFIEYNSNDHVAFFEKNTRYGYDVTYTKKVPTGRFQLSYNFYNHQRDVNSEKTFVSIVDEEIMILDDQITFLEKPFVDPLTVMVTDETGTIIYRENIDYALVGGNEFLEIQRIPGGQISNNSIILVDYVATQSSSHQFQLLNHRIRTSLTLFDRFLEVYAGFAKQKYSDVDTTGLTVLKPFNEQLFGAELNYKAFRIGVDYQDFSSNINPYKMMRYFFQVSSDLSEKVRFSLNGNRRYYTRVVQKRQEIFTDVYGKLTFNIGRNSKADFQLGYREQKGKTFDLSLITSQAEISTIYRKLIFSVGGGIFRQEWFGATNDFNNAYFQIIRKF